MHDNDGYYNCYICGTEQESIEEFEKHTNTFDHVQFLFKRNLLSFDHFKVIAGAEKFDLETLDLNDSSFIDNFDHLNFVFDNNREGQKRELGSDDEMTRGIEVDRKPLVLSIDEIRETRDVSSRKESFRCAANLFKCMICDCDIGDLNSFEKHANGKGHQRKLLDLQPKIWTDRCFYKCNICQTFLVSFNNVYDHVNENVVETETFDFVKMFSCNSCEKHGPLIEDLKYHLNQDILNHKKMVEKLGESWACNLCSKSFGLLRSLEKHSKHETHKRRRRKELQKILNESDEN